jgi:hypothetical protein
LWGCASDVGKDDERATNWEVDPGYRPVWVLLSLGRERRREEDADKAGKQYEGSPLCDSAHGGALRGFVILNFEQDTTKPKTIGFISTMVDCTFIDATDKAGVCGGGWSSSAAWID